MSAMIVLRRGQQAMFSNFFLEASHGITATVTEEKSKCKEERQKAVNEKYRGMFDDTQVMQEAQR